MINTLISSVTHAQLHTQTHNNIHDHGQGPFFLGSDISLVDITFAPMLERANASLAYYKGFFMRGKGAPGGFIRFRPCCACCACCACCGGGAALSRPGADATPLFSFPLTAPPPNNTTE